MGRYAPDIHKRKKLGVAYVEKKQEEPEVNEAKPAPRPRPPAIPKKVPEVKPKTKPRAEEAESEKIEVAPSKPKKVRKPRKRIKKGKPPERPEPVEKPKPAKKKRRARKKSGSPKREKLPDLKAFESIEVDPILTAEMIRKFIKKKEEK